MFGSAKQPSLIGTAGSERTILLSMPAVLTAAEAVKKLSDCVAAYRGNKEELMFGYWDYGSTLVVTAPRRREP